MTFAFTAFGPRVALAPRPQAGRVAITRRGTTTEPRISVESSLYLRPVGRPEEPVARRGEDLRIGVSGGCAELRPLRVLAERAPRLLARGNVREGEHVGEAREGGTGEVAGEEDRVEARPPEDR